MRDLKARMVALEVEVSRFTRMEVKSAGSARNEEGMVAGSQRRLEVEKGQKKEEVGTREGQARRPTQDFLTGVQSFQISIPAQCSYGVWGAL